MKKHYKVEFVVVQEQLATIFGLLHNEATDFKLTEVEPNSHHPVPRKKTNSADRYNWALALWPAVEKVIKSNGDKPIAAKDPRLLKAMTDSGMKKTSVSPCFTGLVRLGKVKRLRKGFYELAK